MVDLQAVTLVTVLGGMGGLYLLQFKISTSIGKLQQEVKALVTKQECHDKHTGLLKEREADTRECDARHGDLHRERETDRIALAELRAFARSSHGGGGQ